MPAETGGYNSTKVLIHKGDPEMLKRLGMTKQEANAKLNAWEKNCRLDSVKMEAWYNGLWRGNKKGEKQW